MIGERTRAEQHPPRQPARRDAPRAGLQRLWEHLGAYRRRLVAPGPWAVALVVIVVAAYFVERGLQSNAGTHMFLTASIVDRGTVTIDPFKPYTIDIAGANGHYYADKAPGLSLLAVPLYALVKVALVHGQSYLSLMQDGSSPMADWVRYIMAVAFAAVPTGIVAALLYRLVERLGARRGWCATLALTYGLGTIARPFASVFFSHQLAAALCFGGFVLLWKVRRVELDVRIAPVALALAGLLLGYALITEYPTAIIVGALFVYLVTASVPWRETVRRVALLGLGMVPAFIVDAVYNTAAFGSPMGLGYSHLAGPQVFREGQSQGLFGVTYPHWDAIWGTTFSPYRGLFFLSPVLLLAIPGCILLIRRAGWRAEGWLCAAIGAGYLLFNVSYFAWNGGTSMGPRQIVPCLPFLVLPIGELVRPVYARAWRVAAGWLAAYSIAVVEIGAAVRPLFDQDLPSPLTQIVLPRLAGLPVERTDMWSPALMPALLHQFPLFLAARLDYNWAQLPDLPGMTQLYPLAALVAIILLWGTLKADVFPRMQPVMAQLRDSLRAHIGPAR